MLLLRILLAGVFSHGAQKFVPQRKGLKLALLQQSHAASGGVLNAAVWSTRRVQVRMGGQALESCSTIKGASFDQFNQYERGGLLGHVM